MNTPIESQAAWRGGELLQREDWELVLSENDLNEINVACKQATERGILPEGISAEEFPLPKLSARLARVQETLETGSGATMVRGFPVQRYSEQQTRLIFCGLMSHVGTAVPQTADGQKLFSVRDERLPDDHPQSRGPSSSKKLSFHTDRCDVIAFLCLQQAKRGGENELVSSVSLYNAILATRPDLVEVLMKPYYYQRHNVDAENEHSFYQQPVFSIYEGYFTSQLLRVLIERADQSPEVPTMTELQREALDTLESLAEDTKMHVRFRQERGDMLLLNNLVLLHRRTEFEDHDEIALRRHLLRLWLAMPNSRPLDPAFQVSYGATQAGALRGGMFQRAASS